MQCGLVAEISQLVGAFKFEKYVACWIVEAKVSFLVLKHQNRVPSVKHDWFQLHQIFKKKNSLFKVNVRHKSITSFQVYVYHGRQGGSNSKSNTTGRRIAFKHASDTHICWIGKHHKEKSLLFMWSHHFRSYSWRVQTWHNPEIFHLWMSIRQLVFQPAFQQYVNFSALNISSITSCQFSIVDGVGFSHFLVIVFLLLQLYIPGFRV